MNMGEGPRGHFFQEEAIPRRKVENPLRKEESKGPALVKSNSKSEGEKQRRLP